MLSLALLACLSAAPAQAGANLTGDLLAGDPYAGVATRVPHSRQNFAAAGSSTPHSAHRAETGVPHSRQNFARSGFS